MVNNKVGFVAGDIYRRLNSQGEASLNDLRRDLNLTPAMLQMGVGWLAREDKVEIAKRGAGYVIRLKA